MNAVILAQANHLMSYTESHDLEAHLYLERMQLSVDVQDQMLDAIAHLTKRTPHTMCNCIEAVLAATMDSNLPELMTH